MNNYTGENEIKTECCVVITGIGVVSPVGIGKEDFWTKLMEGESGMRKITRFDASSFPSHIAAEVDDFNEADYLSKKEIRFFSQASRYVCVAAELARRDSLLTPEELNLADVLIGSGVSSLTEMEKLLQTGFDEEGNYREGADPLGMIRGYMFAPATAVAHRYDARGYVSMLSSACTSGINALGVAAARIRAGKSRVALVGAVDTPVNKTVVGAFCASGYLTTENENPEEALRPLDQDRTRIGLGEGAGMFVLEEKERALERGAHIYGEVLGFAQQTENANELFLLEKGGARWAETIQIALEEAAGRRDGRIEIDYINAHAPSDLDVDRVEYLALKLALGEKLSDIPAGSIKGSVGSPLAAAGAFQIAAAVMTLLTGEIPPTANYYIPDPDIEMDVKRNARRREKIRNVLVNGHGIGGVNSALILGTPR